jgi:hypothetical protein
MTSASCLFALFVLCSACSPAKPNPEPQPQPTAEPAPELDEVPAGLGGPEKLDSGKDCAAAEGLCENGICKVTIKNTCKEPVTCEFQILAMCRGETETGEARGKGRGTVPAGGEGELEAGADCEGKFVTGTTFESMSCK